MTATIDDAASSQLRVLAVSSTYPRWAGDSDPGFVHELCKRLVNRGISVEVLAPCAPGAREHEVIDDVRISRFRYFFHSGETLTYEGGVLAKLKSNPLLYLLVPLFLAGLFRAVRQRMNAGKVDLVHAHWIFPQAFMAACAIGRNGPPVLVTSHGGDLFGLRAWPFRKTIRWTLARCRSIAVVSRYMRTVMTESGLADPAGITILPMGVELDDRFSIDPDVSREKGRVVFVGRLVEKKGVRHLISAMAIVCRRCPDARLSIIGDGPLRAELERQSQVAGLEQAIEFRGAMTQDQIPDLLRRASVAAIPSVIAAGGDQEGLGLVTIEAMGCGCPVVASDLPAIRDVVADGQTGLLAEPGDADSLAQAIVRLLSDDELARKLAGQARQHVVDNYNWDQVAEHYAREMIRMADTSNPA